jgi:hypothetical protein
MKGALYKKNKHYSKEMATIIAIVLLIILLITIFYLDYRHMNLIKEQNEQYEKNIHELMKKINEHSEKEGAQMTDLQEEMLSSVSKLHDMSNDIQHNKKHLSDLSKLLNKLQPFIDSDEAFEKLFFKVFPNLKTNMFMTTLRPVLLILRNLTKHMNDVFFDKRLIKHLNDILVIVLKNANSQFLIDQVDKCSDVVVFMSSDYGTRRFLFPSGFQEMKALACENTIKTNDSDMYALYVTIHKNLKENIEHIQLPSHDLLKVMNISKDDYMSLELTLKAIKAQIKQTPIIKKDNFINQKKTYLKEVFTDITNKIRRYNNSIQERIVQE